LAKRFRRRTIVQQAEEQAEGVKSIEEAKPVEADTADRRVDSVVRASVLEADLAKKNMDIEASEKLHTENKQADEKQKAAHEAERKKLDQEKQEIEKQKKIAEQEIEIRRKEEEERLNKQMEAELNDWKEDEVEREKQFEGRESQAEHIKRIKERAEAARKGMQESTESLFDDIASQISSNDHHKLR
jgi:hypothetical protein